MTAPPTRPGQVVSVLADDLTGATDSVLQFRTAGWSAYLLLSGDTPPEVAAGASVALSRSLDTRPLIDDEAADRTSAAVAEQVAAGVSRLYLKVDSTVRGSIAGQVTGALRGWARAYADPLAVICPAYPRMGRTVVDGQVLVNGVPLDQSAAGFDPVTPVRSADLTDLVQGARTVPNAATPEEVADLLTAAADDGADRLVVDATDDEDLARLAAAVQTLGRRVVCVGSAGLARHLAVSWLPEGTGALADTGVDPISRVLVAMTSLNEVSLDQADHLAAAFGDRLLRHELVVDGAGEPGVAPGDVPDLPGHDPNAVVLVQPSPKRIRSTDQAETARGIARGVAATAQTLVNSGAVTGLVLVGGDGAEATLQLLGATALRVEAQASEGVPLCRIVGGPAAGLPVATKAGGFGSATTLTDVVNAMLESQEATS